VDYYTEWSYENFFEEGDCLAGELWMRDDVERYVRLMRSGEKRRKWLLKDYKFEDLYEGKFDFGRLDRWEKRALALVDEYYRVKGWYSRPLPIDDVDIEGMKVIDGDSQEDNNDDFDLMSFEEDDDEYAEEVDFEDFSKENFEFDSEELEKEANSEKYR